MGKASFIVIVGCGRLGSLLGTRLSSEGHSVVVIDSNEKAFSLLEPGFSGFCFTGDASELEVLREARLGEADFVLAMTEKDTLNLMVAQVASTVFNIPRVLARVYDPRKEAIYREFGVETISPTNLSSEAFLRAIGERAAGG